MMAIWSLGVVAVFSMVVGAYVIDGLLRPFHDLDPFDYLPGATRADDPKERD
jgi:hypothetical protein